MLRFFTSGKKLDIVLKENKFGAISFERISGYILVNATYLAIENINVISCISECKNNKGCLSLNFRKKNDGGTVCELNEADRFTAESEMDFRKQTNCDHYEIQVTL